MPRPIRWLSVVAVALTLTSCSHVLQAAGGPDELTATEDDPDPQHVALKVDNNNWSDVVISLEHDGRSDRIATVKGASSSNLKLPRPWFGAGASVRLVAHRIGSTSIFRSEGFTVPRGTSVQWTLESDLQRSSLAIW